MSLPHVPVATIPVVTRLLSPVYPVHPERTPDAGVPRAGVTKVGLVANTSAPLPVSSVTADFRLAEDGVPKNVATPDPSDVIPVPPFATGSVPVMPPTGRPVQFVRVPEAGVPRASPAS